MKKVVLVVVYVYLYHQILLGQFHSIDRITSGNSVPFKECELKIRDGFIFVGVGLFEIFQFGIGYQVDKKYSIALKYASTWLSYGGSYINPGIGTGIGISTSCYKNIWLFNKISIDYIYYIKLPIIIYNSEKSIKPNGGYLEITFGQEEIEDNEKFQFYWACGIGVSYPHRSKILVLPTIKIGTQLNL